jgi:hypothetical protein
MSAATRSRLMTASPTPDAWVSQLLAGEPFTALGAQIKNGSGAEQTMVAATCGEDPFYIPTP